MSVPVIARHVAILAFTMLLAACVSTPPPAPPLDFKRFQPIYLDVAKIDVVDEYKSPMRAPNVEHLVPISLSDAVHMWVADRLRAAGRDRSLQVIIKEGSIIATDLPKPTGLTGLMTISQDKQYNAKLTVEMRIYGPASAMSEANVEATATRSITMPENASAATRDALFRRMIFDMMETMNAELEKNMFMYFGNYINYSQNP